jgi:hypothetical protein
MPRMPALLPLLFAATPPWAGQDADVDPATVDIVDAINCRVDAPTYNGFAMAIGSDGLAERRGWRKIAGKNPFLAEYELPRPVTVAGNWSTRRVGFSSSGVVAILDLADPKQIAAGEGIINRLDTDAAIDAIAAAAAAAAAGEARVATGDKVRRDIPFRKFMGQRVLSDVTEPATEKDGFGTHTVIARSISNATSHPGKTLYGCSYRIELLGRDGKPL